MTHRDRAPAASAPSPDPADAAPTLAPGRPDKLGRKMRAAGVQPAQDVAGKPAVVHARRVECAKRARNSRRARRHG